MPLAAGARLGPYEIVAPIGAGGMGEVYKARDTRVDRTVAVKVLPASVAADPDLRRRFDREARAVAALNHPHICTLHDIGSQDDLDFLVMEHLEGETLADRLGRSEDPPLPDSGEGRPSGRPLPMNEALTIAIQLAGALDKAHRAGITHRDLKPANIMLTKGGAKLLDFGLAKQWAGQAGGAGWAGMAGNAPTMTSPITARGTILGTFQYMAPEQLEGQEADARTDIFAFGAVLYEMLTGRKAFNGKSHASLIGSILKDDPPPISQVQPLTPPALDRVVKKCLAKDPDDRWQSARDLQDELAWIAESGSQVGVTAPAQPVAQPRARWRNVVIPIGAALAAAVAAGTAVWFATRPAGPPRRVSRLQITPPSAAAPGVTALTGFGGANRNVTITPDGSRVIYLGAIGRTLFVRALDRLEAAPLAGGGVSPFVSPDGQWIGFAEGGRLMKVAITRRTGGTADRPRRSGRIPRRHLGSGRHDRLRDQPHGNRPAADSGGRR